jgi:hypothetical protein
MSTKHTPESNTTMKVRIERFEKPHVWYADRIGQTFTVVDVNGIYVVPEMSEIHTHYILKSDCTIIPDETENRVPFNYEIWKEKGGKVWYGNKEVHQLTKFKGCGSITYAGVFDGSIMVFRDSELTMEAPDEVWYANVYANKISSGYHSIEECKKANLVTPLYILEINITKGTNKIVHTYAKPTGNE